MARRRPIGPGRTGHQNASSHALFVTAAITVLILIGLGVVGTLVTAVAFFAVGAGAGYSLSGSV